MSGVFFHTFCFFSVHFNFDLKYQNCEADNTNCACILLVSLNEWLKHFCECVANAVSFVMFGKYKIWKKKKKFILFAVKCVALQQKKLLSFLSIRIISKRKSKRKWAQKKFGKIYYILHCHWHCLSLSLSIYVMYGLKFYCSIGLNNVRYVHTCV